MGRLTLYFVSRGFHLALRRHEFLGIAGLIFA